MLLPQSGGVLQAPDHKRICRAIRRTRSRRVASLEDAGSAGDWHDAVWCV